MSRSSDNTMTRLNKHKLGAYRTPGYITHPVFFTFSLKKKGKNGRNQIENGKTGLHPQKYLKNGRFGASSFMCL